MEKALRSEYDKLMAERTALATRTAELEARCAELLGEIEKVKKRVGVTEVNPTDGKTEPGEVKFINPERK